MYIFNSKRYTRAIKHQTWAFLHSLTEEMSKLIIQKFLISYFI